MYILASGYNGTLYVGVTSDLMTRIAQHRSGAFDGFTKRYRRDWKRNLIERDNPASNDLSVGLGFLS